MMFLLSRLVMRRDVLALIPMLGVAVAWGFARDRRPEPRESDEA